MSDREPMTYGDDFKYIPAMSLRSGQGMEVRPDVYCHTIQIANIGLFGSADAADYVLIDAGMPKSADDVRAAVEKRFGANRPPHAIILTHGHFDHVFGTAAFPGAEVFGQRSLGDYLRREREA